MHNNLQKSLGFNLSSVYFLGSFLILYIQLFISYQNVQIDNVQITGIFTYPQQNFPPGSYHHPTHKTE